VDPVAPPPAPQTSSSHEHRRETAQNPRSPSTRFAAFPLRGPGWSNCPDPGRSGLRTTEVTTGVAPDLKNRDTCRSTRDDEPQFCALSTPNPRVSARPPNSSFPCAATTFCVSIKFLRARDPPNTFHPRRHFTPRPVPGPRPCPPVAALPPAHLPLSPGIVLGETR